MTTHFAVYCDESSEWGKYYSHFYGGALVLWNEREAIEASLKAKKDELNLKGEVKWSKITENYTAKYVAFIDHYFDLIAAGKIKVRLMFTQNINVPPELDEERVDNEYFLLYYQFVKHAFGLRYWNCDGEPGAKARVTLYLDDPPQNANKFHSFKMYLSSLSAYPVFSNARVSMAYDDITGVNSKAHNILQGLDIILGGVQSRLNEQHTKPQPPLKRRGKRAKAKALVYTHIKDRIWSIYPRFNVGCSTATQNGLEDRWRHAYRHWLFRPNDSTVDLSRKKK